MAKRPTTDHAKAIGAYINGWITREEYQMCYIGEAWVSGKSLFAPGRMGWGRMRRDQWVFAYRGKVATNDRP